MSSRRRKPELMEVINNDDIMTDILLRLPLKTLLGCKCVCKWWNNLISDPLFKSIYTERNPQCHVSGFFLQKFLYYEPYSELLYFPCEGLIDAAPKPSLTFIEDDKGVCIQDSCNGLFICSGFRCSEEDRKYYICKPTTKQYHPLPKPKSRSVFGINIAYEPKKSPHYKIVCISNSYLSVNHRQINIFSPITDSWQASGNPFTVSDDDDMLFNRGVFWQSALHWIGRRNSGLRFDPETEILLPMPMPPVQDGGTDRMVRYFGESGGHLFLINTPLTAGFDVMEMKADYSGWFLKYHLNFNMLVLQHPAAGSRRVSILRIVHQHVGNEDESFMVIHVRGKFVAFKIRDYTLLELQGNNTVDEGLGLWYLWEGVYPYSNTYCYL